jgi:hypothetical protein
MTEPSLLDGNAKKLATFTLSRELGIIFPHWSLVLMAACLAGIPWVGQLKK